MGRVAMGTCSFVDTRQLPPEVSHQPPEDSRSASVSCSSKYCSAVSLTFQLLCQSTVTKRALEDGVDDKSP